MTKPVNLMTSKQPDAITGIIASGCPSDPSCFCEDKIFRLELLAGMTTNCTAVDIAGEWILSLAAKSVQSRVFLR